MFAVVRAAGKQHRVEEGEVLTIDAGARELGSTIELEVLAYGDGDDVRVGSPLLDGISVTAEVVGSRKGKKIDVLRYKNKVRHRKARGHRQQLVEARITKIAVR